MEDALLFQLRSALNKPVHAASLLEESMEGIGTKDRLLVSRVIRYHWDQRFMADVKRAYQDRFRKSLANRIKGETSGDYERLLLGCIGESV
jgi:annexin A7/11